MNNQARTQQGPTCEKKDTEPGPPWCREPRGLPSDTRIGTTIGADYIVRELVGSGGMGCVYRAEQPRLGRDVAIKLLHPHLLGDERIVSRFRIEARAAGRLTHPNSVAVIDFGIDACKIPFLVMEFLQGQHLRSLLKRGHLLPPLAAVRLVLEVLSALSEAHARGVVHHDVKPENIFLVPRYEGGHYVKVVDFGLARLMEEDHESPSQPGQAAGTPGYTAPEQWLGEPADGRADLYALGALLYELLTGQLPFSGDVALVVKRHLTERPLPPSAIAPGLRLPPALDEIVSKALEKRPSDRFSSAGAMATALRKALDGLDAQQTHAPRCGGCGAANHPSDSFCGGCGSPRVLRPPGLSLTTAPAASADPESPDRADSVSPLALLSASEQEEHATERSDLDAVVTACRRGLALARRACVSTGDEVFDPSMISFSTKLGEALVRSGHLAEAEGVLREVLPYLADLRQRAWVLALLGRVAAGRGSRDRAKSFYTEALAVLAHAPDLSLIADIHEARAAVFRDGGESNEAILALRAACYALGQVPASSERHAGALLSLGLLLVEVGQLRRALVELSAAHHAALHGGLSALASTCSQALGDVRAGLGASASSPPPPA